MLRLVRAHEGIAEHSLTTATQRGVGVYDRGAAHLIVPLPSARRIQPCLDSRDVAQLGDLPPLVDRTQV